MFFVKLQALNGRMITGKNVLEPLDRLRVIVIYGKFKIYRQANIFVKN